MSFEPPPEQPELEPESERPAQAYYAATRWLALERTTLLIALFPALLEALRAFGFSITNRPVEGTVLLILRWIAFLPFLLLDSLLIKTRPPFTNPLGPFHPRRLWEKFALQHRAWQLLLVLFLPIAASLIALLFYIPGAR